MAPMPPAQLASDQLVSETEAAEFLNITPSALRGRRQRGVPPAFIKLGDGPKAPVRYSMRTLQEMVHRGTRTSTNGHPLKAA